jgi:hypothetical protein
MKGGLIGVVKRTQLVSFSAGHPAKQWVSSVTLEIEGVNVFLFTG